LMWDLQDKEPGHSGLARENLAWEILLPNKGLRGLRLKKFCGQWLALPSPFLEKLCITQG